jgi:hypothetical protein
MSYARWSDSGVYIYWESNDNAKTRDDQVLRVMFSLANDAWITYGEITKLGLEASIALCYERASYGRTDVEANVVRTSIIAFLHDVEVEFRHEASNSFDDVVKVSKLGNAFVYAVVMLVGVAITTGACVTAILKHTRTKWARRRTS